MSIRQEKNKKKWTKDGRKWFFDVYYFDEFGKRKEKKSKLFKTQGEAKDAERDFLNSLDNNEFDNKNISFIEVYNNWLSIKKKKLKITTYYGLVKKIDKHILSFFKEYNLHTINLNIINKWYEEMNKKELTLKYTNNIIGYLQEIFNFAKENYNFDYRVANNIFKYKISTTENKKKRIEDNYWTLEEFNTFIKYVDDKYYKLIFITLYYTGLRIGELIGLNWNDIDLENKIIDINKTFSNKVGNNSYVLVDPKTTNSIRKVEIDDQLNGYLLEHYNCEKQIYNFNKEMFVFGNVNHVSPTTLNRKLKDYINKSNSKNITLHGFRHSHVSLLINLGCDSREVAERVGDTVRVIEKVYYHMFPKKKNHTIMVLNGLNKD